MRDVRPGGQLAVHEIVEFFRARKHFRRTAQKPSTDLLYRHGTNHVYGHAQAVSEGELALRAGAASGVLVPITDQRVATMLNEIEIISNDLADGLLKAIEIARFSIGEIRGLLSP